MNCVCLFTEQNVNLHLLGEPIKASVCLTEKKYLEITPSTNLLINPMSSFLDHSDFQGWNNAFVKVVLKISLSV